jgi:16S rRNA (cytidine1402-2'-O)-methyltransferase
VIIREIILLHPPMPGTLFVVATPIGNLEDLTFRALRTLREVDLIAAEDTRRTSKLLARYEIRKPLVSLREHNEARQAPVLVGRLLEGETVALVSDAGTPGIADPGTRLVAAAREARIPVVPVPGASAVAAALSVSGFVANQFVFMGFAPRSGSARKEWMAEVADEPRTVVFLEAPHRIRRTVRELTELLVNRPISINRELTKINESSVVSPINAVSIDDLREQGEFTIVVAARSVDGVESDPEPFEVTDLFGYMTQHSKINDSLAADLVAIALHIDPRKVRSIVKKAKIAERRRSGPAS